MTSAITADGVEVKRGDIVWRVFSHGLVTRSKVGGDTLKVWSWWRLHESMYATERAALTVAVAAARRRLKKARQNVRSEARSVERLTARLASLDA